MAIAVNLMEMAELQTPIIAILIGEGCSGGALGIGMGDVVAMLEHSYYSVISPEGCASILWKDASKKEESAKMLKMQAEFLKEKQIIDDIILEPLGGAHHDPQEVYSKVKDYILLKSQELENIDKPLLIARRYEKYRSMGESIDSVKYN
jgi:acetyl-CoA carboxylase carboxyl transferase subunit alpha